MATAVEPRHLDSCQAQNWAEVPVSPYRSWAQMRKTSALSEGDEL
eukprot:CAMPEP_0181522150 /NCGR_PEP_ID=MMETSP1110-20121109/67220_1 /TAXON_ID=174948 /ORGANISM="Symbiodinium sp., Strain CCMP421" /LENGTH=44 /DNA_ID= /DNA_START= /DNA_END= /DNA_ORIENTATION=